MGGWCLVALQPGRADPAGEGLHEVFLGGEHNAFIMELPLYQLPNLRGDRQGVWAASGGLLAMARNDHPGGFGRAVGAISLSPAGRSRPAILASLGAAGAAGALMGLDWQMMVALLTSFVRKENTIPTLAVLYGAGRRRRQPGRGVARRLTPPAALAFLAVQVLFIPCVATVATIRQETDRGAGQCSAWGCCWRSHWRWGSRSTRGQRWWDGNEIATTEVVTTIT